MPAGYVFDDSVLNRILQQFRSWLASEDPWTLHLFTNDHTPADGDDESDYTEATFTGYSAIALDPGEWDAISVTAFIATLEYTPAPQFDYTSGAGGAVTIYGYYLLDDGGDFKVAERVATSKIISPGDGIKVTPRLRLKTCRE